MPDRSVRCGENTRSQLSKSDHRHGQPIRDRVRVEGSPGLARDEKACRRARRSWFVQIVRGIWSQLAQVLREPWICSAGPQVPHGGRLRYPARPVAYRFQARNWSAVDGDRHDFARLDPIEHRSRVFFSSRDATTAMRRP